MKKKTKKPYIFKYNLNIALLFFEKSRAIDH